MVLISWDGARWSVWGGEGAAVGGKGVWALISDAVALISMGAEAPLGVGG